MRVLCFVYNVLCDTYTHDICMYVRMDLCVAVMELELKLSTEEEKGKILQTKLTELQVGICHAL